MIQIKIRKTNTNNRKVKINIRYVEKKNSNILRIYR